MEQPKIYKGNLSKRGPSSLSGWNRRWVVIADNKLNYYKEQNDPALVQSIDLNSIMQISKTPDSYPKDLREGAFSFDVQEQKEIKTYYFAAPSANEKELVLRCILEWRKWSAQLKKTVAVDVPSLQKQLAEAQRTIEALSEQLRKVREEQSVAPSESASSLSADYDLLAETVDELRSENARLTEALDEEKAQHQDLKKQFLELKRQMSNMQNDEEEEDPLDFFKKK